VKGKDLAFDAGLSVVCLLLTGSVIIVASIIVCLQDLATGTIVSIVGLIVLVGAMIMSIANAMTKPENFLSTVDFEWQARDDSVQKKVVDREKLFVNCMTAISALIILAILWFECRK